MHIVAIGGSDAGISAALRAREVNPGAEFTVVVADAYRPQAGPRARVRAMVRTRCG